MSQLDVMNKQIEKRIEKIKRDIKRNRHLYPGCLYGAAIGEIRGLQYALRTLKRGKS